MAREATASLLAAPQGLLLLRLSNLQYQQLHFGKKTAGRAANIFDGYGLHKRVALVDVVNSKVFDLDIEERFAVILPEVSKRKG